MLMCGILPSMPLERRDPDRQQCVPSGRRDDDRHRLLTIDEVAEVLDVPPETVCRFIRAGLLHAAEPEPGLMRLDSRDVAAFLERHPWLRGVAR